MSDKHKDIEELFKDAASNASGPPPPPADWGAMSSILQESALIQTGAGAGAAKVGILKALGTKAVMLKVVAGTVLVGGGLTGSYILLKDEPSANVAENTLDQTIQSENKSIDPSTTIGYNDHLSPNHSANTQISESARANSSSLLNIRDENGAKSPFKVHEDAQSDQTRNLETQTTTGEGHFTEPQGEQTFTSSTPAGTAMDNRSASDHFSKQESDLIAQVDKTSNASEKAPKSSLAAGTFQTTESSELTSAAERGIVDGNIATDTETNIGTLASVDAESNTSDTDASTENKNQLDTELAMIANASEQTNTNTSNSPENTVDADHGASISANSNTDPSVSTGTTGAGNTSPKNHLSTVANPNGESTTSGAGNVEVQLALTEQTGGSTQESGNGLNSTTDDESASAVTNPENLETANNAITTELSSNEEAELKNATALAEKNDNGNTSTLQDLKSSSSQTEMANDGSLPTSVDSALMNEIAQSDSTKQIADENALALTDSLIEVSDSSAPQIGSITMRPEEPRWLLSPYFSIDRSNYAIDQFTLSNLAGSTKDLTIGSNGTTFSAGIRGAYNIAPYLWFESGFLYSKKSGIQGIMELYDDNNEVTALANYQLTGDFYEVPLALGVRSNNGYFGWYFKAGVNLAYNRATTSSFFEYYDFEAEKVFTIKPSIRTLNPVIAASAGFEYNVLPQLRFYAEPNFRFATRPVLNTTEFDQIPLNPKWSTIGLGIGINYYFGKK